MHPDIGRTTASTQDDDALRQPLEPPMLCPRPRVRALVFSACIFAAGYVIFAQSRDQKALLPSLGSPNPVDQPGPTHNLGMAMMPTWYWNWSSLPKCPDAK